MKVIVILAIVTVVLVIVVIVTVVILTVIIVTVIIVTVVIVTVVIVTVVKVAVIGKAYKRMWIIRRLKALGASRSCLLDVLQKQVLSVLQLAVPAWDCFLTCQERTYLERVLKNWP